MEMRKSRVLRKMRGGQVAVSIKMNLADPRVAELAAMSGFDCVWVDMEHVPSDWGCIENVVRAAKNFDCDVLTRVAKGCYSDYIRPLEADSAGIMVPHLMSLEEARRIVYYTKFHPIGRRPIDGGNADGRYAQLDGGAYMAQANRERFVVVQIEDPEPLPELEEICALPGIDMIFFGPADFSQGIGAPNDFSHPRVEETRRLIPRMARKYNKFTGTVGGPGNFQELVDMGYHFLNVGADILILGSAYRALTDQLMDRPCAK